MLKRILAGIVGTAALLAGLIALVSAVELLRDFSNADVPIHLTGAGELAASSIAFAAIVGSFRFFRFAARGPTDSRITWLRPLLLGIGCFFPAILLSFPFTSMLAQTIWPGDGQSSLAAMEFSLYVGVVAEITCCAVFLRKSRRTRTVS